MDKFFLLTYTCVGYDGFQHSYHAWFSTEDDMRMFVKESETKKTGFETELSIEILSHREIVF